MDEIESMTDEALLATDTSLNQRIGELRAERRAFNERRGAMQAEGQDLVSRMQATATLKGLVRAEIARRAQGTS